MWGSFDGDHVLGVTPARFRPSGSIAAARLFNYSGQLWPAYALAYSGPPDHSCLNTLAIPDLTH